MRSGSFSLVTGSRSGSGGGSRDLDVADVRALAVAGDEIRGWNRGDAPARRPGARAARALCADGGRRRGLRGGGALLRHRGGPARGVLRRAAGDAAQRARRGRRGGRGPRGVRLAVQRPREIAYRAHQGFAHAGHRALGPASSAWSGATWARAGWRSPSIPSRASSDVVFITAAWGLGELVVQGQVNPDEFYVHKPSLAAGRPSILRRERGSKALKMVCHEDPAKRVAVVRCRPRRPAPLLPERRRSDRARPRSGGHRAPLRPGDGHRVGAGRGGRAHLHPPGPPGDGAEPSHGTGGRALRAEGARGRFWPRAGASASGSGPAPRGWC